MRSSRRGGGRRADHPFPLVPRDPENLDRDPETLKRQTAYLACALNDPTELNALHAAQTSATPDASEVLNSLGQYLGVPGFEREPSSGGARGLSAEERPPPLAKGVLPEVARGDHDAYLRKVAGWGAFTAANADRRARDAEDEADGRRRNAFDADDDAEHSCATSGIPSSNGEEKERRDATDRWTLQRSSDLDRHAHEDVPAMYFDDSFDLSDPAVFRRAFCPDDDDDDLNDTAGESSRSRASTSSSHPTAVRRSRALFGLAAQTRLGSYLDKIETSLVLAIGSRSESFFEASARLHELDAFVSETCETIERTRRTLLDASTYAARARESVASLHSKRANLAALADAFEQLATVRECREDLDVLRRAGDWGGSLEACEDVRRAIADPSLPPGLRLLEDVAHHADVTEREVVDALVCEFVRAARVQPGSVGYVQHGGERGDDGGGDSPGGDSPGGDSPGGGGSWSPATTRAALAAVRAAARDAGMEGVEDEEEEEDEEDEEDAYELGLGPGEASAADVRESLLPPLMALTRGATDRVSGGRIADAMRAWGRAAAADARACVRAACIACIAAVQPGGEYAVAEPGGRNASPESFSGGGRDGIIQRAIGALPPSVFAVVVRAVTTALAGHFARADIVRSAVRSALGTAPRRGDDDVGRGQKTKNDDEKNASGTPTDECARAACAALPAGERAAASAAASDAVLALTDAAQGAVARAIASLTKGCTLAEFSNVCDAADDFLERAERLGGGRRCLALRATLAAQCKDLFAARHAAFAAKLGVVLEAETWTAATPVPPEFQRVLDDVVSFAAAGREGNEESGDASVTTNGDASSRAGAEDALVLPNTGERVVPVGASLALLKMLRDHVASAARFPSLAPTAVHKTAELLRVFNARTAALVLGAGAMRTAGLRSITAKHLALATESVRLFSLVTPLLSAALEPALPQSRRRGLLADFDGTVKDLATHKRELHAKTVGIMRDRLAHHSSRLPTIWCSRVFTERSRKAGSSVGWRERTEEDESKGESKEDAEARGPSEFATALGKEIGTLRRVIAGTLCPRDASAVLDEVLAHFDECATGTLREARRSVAKEWMAKMGDDGGEGSGSGDGAGAEGVAEGGAEGGDDAEIASKAPPSDEEVRALITLDGAALLECLGTLVKGGEGGDGAVGAPALTRFLSEL